MPRAQPGAAGAGMSSVSNRVTVLCIYVVWSYFGGGLVFGEGGRGRYTTLCGPWVDIWTDSTASPHHPKKLITTTGGAGPAADGL